MSKWWDIAWEYREARAEATVYADSQEEALAKARYCALNDFHEHVQVEARKATDDRPRYTEQDL